MKKITYKLLSLALVLGFGVGFLSALPVWAEDSEENSEAVGTSISLSPVSKVLELSSKSTYDDSVQIKNDGKNDLDVEVYAAPYSYVYSEDDDVYKLGFNKENSFTQITRWITFKDSGGSWVNKATFTLKPGETTDVAYRVSTPDNIPAGGQYAVIFAHTLSGETTASGIKTEASPGMIIYGRSTEGETIVAAEISNMNVERKINEESKQENFFASAKVKNTGNVDFSAVGVLKVDAIIGTGSYETTGTDNNARISVIPESELVVSDEWKDSPSFGIYKVTWTVTAGEETETVEKIVFVNPVPFIIFSIILLTIIIVVVIIEVRKRKERRSRLAV
ncbi:hypothetical protein IJJ02_01380 [Candidatus Saccharibacteria bacterium]|nr:hypothetical protein [Candidatus Saccharibacteria bacterium]